MIHYLTVHSDLSGPDASGPDRGMTEYLDFQGQSLANRVRVLFYEDLPLRTSWERGTYIVSAFDQLTTAGQLVTRTLTDALSREQGRGIRVVNTPDKTLTRFSLLTELHRCGRNSFRTVRAKESLDGMRYPVFLRSEWRHYGASTPLLTSRSEVERSLGELVLRGTPVEELIVVEFCDTADAAGMYRKYAAFIVGDEIIPRSLSYGRHWMLKHGTTEFTVAMAAEERDYLLGNPHREALRDIFALAGIEYGRMDYALRGDAIEVWEINLNPTIGRGRQKSTSKIAADVRAIRHQGRDAFFRRFERALVALDTAASPEPPLSVRLDSAVLRGSLMVRSKRARLGLARALYRAFRPVLQPVARVLFPLMGRLTRGRRPR